MQTLRQKHEARWPQELGLGCWLGHRGPAQTRARTCLLSRLLEKMKIRKVPSSVASPSGGSALFSNVTCCQGP